MAYSLKQLLTLRDRDFVINAYRVLLLREPDLRGLEKYLGLLQQGKGRLEILRRIRYSPEGKGVAVDVRSIRPGLFLAGICSLPLFGRLLRPIAGFLPFPGISIYLPHLGGSGVRRHDEVAVEGENIDWSIYPADVRKIYHELEQARSRMKKEGHEDRH